MKIVIISESEFTVQGHGVHTAFVEMTNSLRQQEDITVVTNRRDKADIRHIHTVGPYALFHLLALSGKKVVSAHIIPESLVGSLFGARYWLPLARWYLRWFYNRADLVIAVSKATADQLMAMGVRTKIAVVDNTIDTARYVPLTSAKQTARAELGIERKAWVVVSNGQVQPRKRVDTFIRLARDLPDMKFVWVGGIPFKHTAASYQQMKHIIDRAPDNVVFSGVIPLDSVKQYFWAADVFIMPSDQETFGLAIVEAAASGLPVLLRDIHDYDHTFRPNALMCDEDTFSEGLIKLRDEPEYYREMVRQAKLLAARYDSRAGAQKLAALYHSLLTP